MLFNEPKLLKSGGRIEFWSLDNGFSALQRAEIAEIDDFGGVASPARSVSVLFNEPKLLKSAAKDYAFVLRKGFSALQRAEIAEIVVVTHNEQPALAVSVLFNEPKLLKCWVHPPPNAHTRRFQCSSTSRNC